MTDIQQARDVLTKWRKDAAKGAWDLSWEWSTFTSQQVKRDNGYIGDTDQPHDARLIVGTAGNPDLLDAWDGLLGIFQNEPETAPRLWPELWVEVQRIVAAIIAADERMTS